METQDYVEGPNSGCFPENVQLAKFEVGTFESNRDQEQADADDDRVQNSDQSMFVEEDEIPANSGNQAPPTDQLCNSEQGAASTDNTFSGFEETGHTTEPDLLTGRQGVNSQVPIGERFEDFMQRLINKLIDMEEQLTERDLWINMLDEKYVCLNDAKRMLELECEALTAKLAEMELQCAQNGSGSNTPGTCHGKDASLVTEISPQSNDQSELLTTDKTLTEDNKKEQVACVENGQDDSPADLVQVSPENFIENDTVNVQQGMMDDIKVLTLFPEVLKICWDKFSNGSKLSPGWLANLCACRLVCRPWKIGIDKLLTTGSGPVYNIGCSTLEIFNLQSSIELMNRWMEAYGDLHDELPFPPGEIIFMDWNVKLLANALVSANCALALGRFLQKFGQEIRIFKYILSNSTMSQYGPPYKWYETFTGWLLLMPNLKELHLSGVKTQGIRKETGGLVGQLDLAGGNPFPMFYNLEVFALTSSGYSDALVLSALTGNDSITGLTLKRIPTTLWSGIFPANQLSSLDLCLSSVRDIDWLCSLHQTGSLEVVKIKTFGTWTLKMDSKIQFEKIARFLVNCERLQWLDITYDHQYCNAPVELSKLEKFTIRLPGSRSRRQMERMFLDITYMVSLMPCLQQLKILGLTGQALEWFRIQGRENQRRLRQWLGNELVTRFWTAAPSLKNVDIELANSSFIFIRAV